MEQINIELVPSGVMSTAHASQFDIGRGIRFNLKDGGTPYTLAGTETITIEMVKPDGSEQTISLTNTSSTYVDWTTADGELDLDGVYSAEISIVQGDDVLGTKNFLVRVEPDPYNGKGLRVVTVGPADICTFEPTISEPLVNVKCELTPSLDGYSEANITRCGNNLLNPDTLQRRKVTSSNILRLSFAPMWLGSGSYTLSFSGSQSIYLCDINNNYATTEIAPNMSPYTFTLTERKLLMFRFSVDTVGELTDTNIQLELGNYSEYHPYTGNAYAIALGDTYYGGTLDVTTGVLTVTWGGVDLGSLSWSFDGDGTYPVFYSEGIKGQCKTTPTELTCMAGSPLTAVTNRARTTLREVADNNIVCITSSGNTGCIAIRNDTYTNPNDFKTAMDGVRFSYELATPIEIDLGSGTAVTARAGVNNVFADCGQTELKYLTIEV